jgi:hypothetical protein
VADVGNRAGGASRADVIIVGVTSAGGVLDIGEYSSTCRAIVPGVAVVDPDSRGYLTPRGNDPRWIPQLAGSRFRP